MLYRWVLTANQPIGPNDNSRPFRSLIRTGPALGYVAVDLVFNKVPFKFNDFNLMNGNSALMNFFLHSDFQTVRRIKNMWLQYGYPYTTYRDDFIEALGGFLECQGRGALRLRRLTLMDRPAQEDDASEEYGDEGEIRGTLANVTSLELRDFTLKIDLRKQPELQEGLGVRGSCCLDEVDGGSTYSSGRPFALTMVFAAASRHHISLRTVCGVMKSERHCQ